jgi:hypothetical protein
MPVCDVIWKEGEGAGCFPHLRGLVVDSNGVVTSRVDTRMTLTGDSTAGCSWKQVEQMCLEVHEPV